MTQTQPKSIADFKRHPVDLPDEFFTNDEPINGAFIWLIVGMALIGVGFGIAAAAHLAPLVNGWLA